MSVGSFVAGGKAAPYMEMAKIVGDFIRLRQQNEQFNRLREDRLNAGGNIERYIDANALPDGFNAEALQILMREFLDKNKQYEDQYGGLQDMFYSGIGDYRGNFDRINTPSDPNQNPVVQKILEQMGITQGTLDPAIANAFGIAANGGRTPQSEGLFDTLMQHGSYANPYISNLTDIGGYMLRNNGFTPYTQNAADIAGYFMRNAGMTPESGEALQNGRDVMGAGRNTLNSGQNLINSTQASGGWDPFGIQQFQTGMTGLQGMPGFYNQDPMNVLGATGRQAVDGLMNNPFTQGGYDTTQATLANFLNRPNISQNDQMMFDASMGRAFGQNPTLNQNMRLAQGVAGQDVNALPEWFSQFQTQGNNLMSLFQGGLNSINPGSFGGGSASFTPASRDLGPVDPKIQEALEKALAEFEKNPLLSDSEVAAFASDKAASIMRGQAQAAQTKAVNQGALAPTLGGGQQDAAIRAFADEGMRLRGDMLREAVMKNAELRLARSGQQSDLAKAMAQIKLGRENIFADLNRADADNATRVSTTNASLADSAAGRSLQASLANAQNNRGLMEAMASIFGGMMNNATTQRGQNVASQTAGIGALADLMNAGTANQKMFLDAASGAAGRGQEQYGQNLAASTAALGQLGQFGTQRNNALSSVLEALSGAAGQVTSRGNALTDSYTSLINNAGKDAANRYGVGMSTGADLVNSGTSGMASGAGAFNDAINGMNDRLGIYSTIASDANKDATSRMSLGANMTKQGIDSVLDYLTQAAGVTKQQQDYALGMGDLGTRLSAARQGGIDNYSRTALGFAENDLGNRSLLNKSFNDYLSNLNLGVANNNNAWVTATAPYRGLLDSMFTYAGGTQNLWGPYAGMWGGR